MLHIIDMLVKLAYSMILAYAAIIGLIVMPPVGIILFFYLRSFMKRQVYRAKA